MTKLIVTPIDVSAPGSYKQRKKFLSLIRRFSEAKDAAPLEVLSLMAETDDLIRSHLATEDDSSVDEILDQLSAKEFDQLLAAIAFEGTDAVPPEKSSS